MESNEEPAKGDNSAVQLPVGLSFVGAEMAQLRWRIIVKQVQRVRHLFRELSLYLQQLGDIVCQHGYLTRLKVRANLLNHHLA